MMDVLQPIEPGDVGPLNSFNSSTPYDSTEDPRSYWWEPSSMALDGAVRMTGMGTSSPLAGLLIGNWVPAALLQAIQTSTYINNASILEGFNFNGQFVPNALFSWMPANYANDVTVYGQYSTTTVGSFIETSIAPYYNVSLGGTGSAPPSIALINSVVAPGSSTSDADQRLLLDFDVQGAMISQKLSSAAGNHFFYVNDTTGFYLYDFVNIWNGFQFVWSHEEFPSGASGRSFSTTATVGGKYWERYDDPMQNWLHLHETAHQLAISIQNFNAKAEEYRSAHPSDTYFQNFYHSSEFKSAEQFNDNLVKGLASYLDIPLPTVLPTDVIDVWPGL